MFPIYPRHVATAFIQVEALMVKYRDLLVNGMEHDIARLESSSRGIAPTEGYIYVLRASTERNSVYKIGRTRDLARRLREHNTPASDDIEVLYTFRTNDVVRVESCVKLWLREKRFRKFKEIYEADIEMIKNVIGGCDAIGTSIKRDSSSKHMSKSSMTGGYFIAVMR